MTDLRFRTHCVVLFITWVFLLPGEEVKNAAAVRADIPSAAFGSCAAPQKIAVIGGGITAAATAAFLKTLGSTPCQTCEEGRAADVREPACGPAVRLDVFEASDRLGGRLDFIRLPVGYVELGGETLHNSNKYMEEFIRMYNADHGRLPSTGELAKSAQRRPTLSARKLVFNGEPIPLWSFRWLTMLRLRARYTVFSWVRLYEVFKKGWSGSRRCSPGVSQTNRASRCARTAFKSGLELLKAVRLDRKVFTQLSSVVSAIVRPAGHPLVQTIVHAVYTQNLSMHTLAGLLSVVCVFGRPLVTRVPHRLVVEHLLQRFADNIHLNCKIEKVFQQTGVTPGGTKAQAYTLEASTCGSLAPDRLREQKYDYVVVATQLSGALRIFRQTENHESVELSVPYYVYQEVFVTVVVAAAINDDATLVGKETTIVATPEHPGGIGTFFVSGCGGVTQLGFVVCKLKTGRELSDEELAPLFHGIRRIERRRWFAYPYMYRFADNSTADTKTNPPAATTFELTPGLFHPNAFEGLFSCMEGQAVAARNVAHLILNAIESKSDEARRASVAFLAEGR